MSWLISWLSWLIGWLSWLFNGDPYSGLLPSLKLTGSLPLKIDGWKTTFLTFWGEKAYFQGRTVSFRESKTISEIELIWGDIVMLVVGKICHA